MNITFYDGVVVDDRVVDKTAAIGAATAITKAGFLREQVDLLKPEFNTTDDIPLSCNYAYIPDFGRWYYCTIEVIRTGILRIYMHVDVLMTWKDAIKASKAVAVRTAKQGSSERGNINEFVVDGSMPMFAYTETCIYQFGDFKSNWTGGAYVCTVG